MRERNKRERKKRCDDRKESRDGERKHGKISGKKKGREERRIIVRKGVGKEERE